MDRVRKLQSAGNFSALFLGFYFLLMATTATCRQRRTPLPSPCSPNGISSLFTLPLARGLKENPLITALPSPLLTPFLNPFTSNGRDHYLAPPPPATILPNFSRWHLFMLSLQNSQRESSHQRAAQPTTHPVPQSIHL